MSDNNIYIAETVGHSGMRQFVSAASTSSARAAVSRTIITVRRAKPAELLGVNPANVLNAETDRMLDGSEPPSGTDLDGDPTPANGKLPLGEPEA